MNYLKKLGISLLYSVLFLIVLNFIMACFSYFNVINGGFIIFFMLFNIVISVFVGAFMMSKNYSKKGWLEGLKFSFVLWILVLFIDVFIYKFSFDLKFSVFSIIFLISGVFGGMVGINYKKK